MGAAKVVAATAVVLTGAAIAQLHGGADGRETRPRQADEGRAEENAAQREERVGAQQHQAYRSESRQRNPKPEPLPPKGCGLCPRRLTHRRIEHEGEEPTVEPRLRVQP